MGDTIQVKPSVQLSGTRLLLDLDQSESCSCCQRTQDELDNPPFIVLAFTDSRIGGVFCSLGCLQAAVASAITQIDSGVPA